LQGIPVVATTDSFARCSLYISNPSSSTLSLPRGAVLALAEPLSSYPARPRESDVLARAAAARQPRPITPAIRTAILDAVKHLPSPRREPLLSLLTEFQDVISRDIYDLGACSLVTHEIHLTDPNPVFRKQFPIPTAHISIVHDHVDQWLKNGIIEPASSPYNSPIFCVGKKGGGVRLCLDYRALNAVSLPTQYCIRTVEECIAEIGLAGSTHFCALDLSSGFYHMPLAKASRPLSAFTVQGRGQFQWRVGAMGLSGCPGSFARLMDLAMRDLPNCITYLDDILVHGPDDRSTLAALRRVLARLRHHNLRLNVSKSLFLRPSTPYLGHTLTQHGILPGPDKSEVLRRCVPLRPLRNFNPSLGSRIISAPTYPISPAAPPRFMTSLAIGPLGRLVPFPPPASRLSKTSATPSSTLPPVPILLVPAPSTCSSTPRSARRRTHLGASARA
jgi:hypothetical protein